MKVLVTGSSGYIGGAVAAALRAGGHEVIALVRDGGAASAEQVGVDTVVGDLADEASLRAAAEDVDGVVHAASSNDERSGELDQIAVTALLDTLAGSDRPFVYTSGMWLHGTTGDQVATEDSPLDPPLVVSWRPAIEDLVRDAAERGVRTVRIRPGLVHGDGGGYIPMLLAPSEGAVRPIDGGANRWAVVHRTDLADLYLRALERGPAGSLYLGVSAESVSVAAAAAAVAAATGTEVRTWPRSEAEETWSVMTEAFLLDQVATNQRARRELGWDPSQPSLLEDLRATFLQPNSQPA